MRTLIAMIALTVGITIGARFKTFSEWMFNRIPPETDPRCKPRFFYNGERVEEWPNG